MAIVQSFDRNESPFDSILHIDANGSEFWYARELMPLLGYKAWQKFNGVIETAKENLETVTAQVIDHITPTDKRVKRPQGGGSKQLDYKLSRLACYHIALCCDSRGNDVVKLAKYYFAKKLIAADYLIYEKTGIVPDIFCHEPLSGRDNSGFVYLVHQSMTRYYKIGKSKTPYTRKQSLQTGSPLEIVIVERYFSMDCGKLEGALHDYYSAYWVRGEWFDFPVNIINEFLSVARELDGVVEESLLRSQAPYIPTENVKEVRKLWSKNKDRQLLIGE